MLHSGNSSLESHVDIRLKSTMGFKFNPNMHRLTGNGDDVYLVPKGGF